MGRAALSSPLIRCLRKRYFASLGDMYDRYFIVHSSAHSRSFDDQGPSESRSISTERAIGAPAAAYYS